MNVLETLLKNNKLKKWTIKLLNCSLNNSIKKHFVWYFSVEECSYVIRLQEYSNKVRKLIMVIMGVPVALKKENLWIIGWNFLVSNVHHELLATIQRWLKNYVFLFDNNLYFLQLFWSILPLHSMETYAFFVKQFFGKSSSYISTDDVSQRLSGHWFNFFIKLPNWLIS
jgi:hypothetical protein